MRIIDERELAELINAGDNSFIGCAVEDEIWCELYERQDGLFETGDWLEGEGAAELICDEKGVILRYEGYYCIIDENGYIG